MSATFPTVATGWRWAETRAGDTLQAIAWRELGDAARWPELAELNDLIPPYLTADPAEALASAGRVLLHGQHIRVFAASDIADATLEPAEVYGSDIALDRAGFLKADGSGDYDVVTGLENLAGALKRRVMTERGELIFHDDYGSTIRAMLGATTTPARAALAARLARDAVARDSRVSRIVSSTAKASGDRIAITINAEAIASGERLTLSTEV